LLRLRASFFAVAVAVLAGASLGCVGDRPQSFRPITSEQQGTLLSAWVASDGTAYFAGGVVGGGDGLLLRWDGRAVATIPTPGAHAFWWIHGVADNEIYLAGESGEVHRFDGATLTLIDAGVSPDATLFGIWGASGDDLWTVGGSFISGGPRQVISRGSASGGWTAVASPADVDPDVTYFKVWGPSASDVWIVGDRGVVLRAGDAGLARADAPGAERYTTVHGCAADDVYAVGGGGSGAAIHFDGASWSPLALGDAPPLAGLACSGGGAYTGGFYGYAALLRGESPVVIEMPPELGALTIHGMAVGGKRVVAVGGDFGAVAPASQRGFAVELAR
jgi:hypothetical protein